MSQGNNGILKNQQQNTTAHISTCSSSASIVPSATSASRSNSPIVSTVCERPILHLNFKKSGLIHQWIRILQSDEFIPARRSKHTAVAYKEAVYVFGGDNGKTMLNDLIRYDIMDKSWGRAFATGLPPAPRYHHSAVVYGNSMFIFGGYTGDIHSNINLTNKNDLFEYKFSNAQWLEWKFTGKAPVPRSGHGAAVYDNKLWIFAGYDGNARLNDMWTISLNSDTKQWEEIEQKGDRPPTCCNFPLAVARNCMYVFSGQSGLQITNTLFEFNFKTNTWRRISNENILRATPPAPARRYGHTMVQHDRFLYVFGGSADNTLPNDLHKYDLDSNVWSVIVPEIGSDIPSGRVYHSGVVIGDIMYIFGGTIDNNVRNGDMYSFKLSLYARCTLHDDFGKLLIEKRFCDVVFIVGPKEEKVLGHIAIIAARSTFLKSRILDAKEIRNKHMENLFGTTKIPLNDQPILEVRLPYATQKAFRMILNYIYTDKINFKDEINNTNIVILLMDIYQLAVQFSIPRLEQLCLQYLEYRILKSNVLDALHNADELNLEVIKEYCLQFIVKDDSFIEIIQSDDLQLTEKSLLVEIIRKRENPSKNIDIKYERLGGTSLESDLAVFLRNPDKEFCDVNLLLNGEIISAHKIILSARCSYFETLFKSYIPLDNTITIQTEDFTPSIETFHSLLRYIYYGDTKMPTEDSLYIFHAFPYYGFTNNRLQAYCKYNLENNINVSNVLQILEASDKMNVPYIKQYALRMIVKDFSQIGQIPQLHTLSRELLLDIITTLSEVQVEPTNSQCDPLQPSINDI